jgi:alkanesulfonate monooxygenase SsuD/methylene tetrahydromethanopterin reductase-like flavin-dependent oxidoreductase (luciferase family)
LDLLGLPDHPYNGEYLDTLIAIADLLSRTAAITVFPDVANLPLRPPAVLARTAATLSALHHGRFALGLGAGQVWDQIVSMGGPRLDPPTARLGLEEAVRVMRALWATDGHARVDGEMYSLSGAWPGPAHSRPVPVWVGAVYPRMLELTGRIADAWAAPIPAYLPYEDWPHAHAHIARGAARADRDARAVRRIAQIVGTVEPGRRDRLPRVGKDPVRSDVRGWAQVAERLVTDHGFDDVVFWPEQRAVDQVLRFADAAELARERLRSAPAGRRASSAACSTGGHLP